MKKYKIGDTAYEVWFCDDTNAYEITKQKVTGVALVKLSSKGKPEEYIFFHHERDNYTPARLTYRTLKEAKEAKKRKEAMDELTKESQKLGFYDV